MKDQVFMVTGATSGIGLETARALAKLGPALVLVGRNAELGAEVTARLQQESGNDAIEFMLADLSMQAEVHQLAHEFLARYSRLDVLINNAGGSYLKRQVSADGIEMSLALNYLAPFLLTNLLLDTILASAPARIVNVSSDVHRSSLIQFDDLQGERSYGIMRAYGQSKLALLLFTYELARRLEGTQVTANALHPGFVATDIFAKSGRIIRLIAPLIKLMAISPEQGAETSIYLATSPDVAGVTGKYFANKRPVVSSPASLDESTAKRLWQISAEISCLERTISAQDSANSDPAV